MIHLSPNDTLKSNGAGVLTGPGIYTNDQSKPNRLGKLKTERLIVRGPQHQQFPLGAGATIPGRIVHAQTNGVASVATTLAGAAFSFTASPLTVTSYYIRLM
jgi:hypothetical protein